MTKPHEETWDNEEDFEIVIVGPERERTKVRHREQLARVAPKMARALLPLAAQRCQRAHLFAGNSCAEEWPKAPTEWCSTCTACAALSEAGVPLP